MHVFKMQTATGSELFSLLTCPHNYIHIAKCLSPLEMSCIKSGRQHSPSTRNVLFCVPSTSQKSACLSPQLRAIYK